MEVMVKWFLFVFYLWGLEMDNERRNYDRAKYTELLKELNTEQSLTLHRIESFGWTLEFVRRPVFEKPVPVVVGADGTKFGVIEADGNLNVNMDLSVRNDKQDDGDKA